MIDVANGKVETLDAHSKPSKEALAFDFNSKEDFSPDADSLKVARKFWAWLLNPVPLITVPKDKCLYIQRPSK